MSDVRRLALGCLLLGWVGPEPPRWLLDALAGGLGGVVLFGSNLGDGSEVGALTARLREAAGREIVIALDEEGGDVTRLDTVRGSSSPGAAALGHLDDEAATESVYRAIGARCARAGVTLDLAPVADVNLDPRNPVIGLRSFGPDGTAAGRQVAAAVRGLQSTGVAACLKHFPGHGATRNDSHHEVAVLDRTAEQLREVELAPFRAGIAAGARAVMTGHLLVPALDPDRLATVSRAVTTDVLRGELGFTGAVVTDALEMRAVSGTIGMVEGFVQALIAGADAIETGALDYPELVGAIPDAVAAAVRDGRLNPARLAEAVERTRALAGAADATRAVGSAAGAAGDGHPVGSAGAAGTADPGEGVAARCLEVRGRLPRLDRPLVIECRTPNGMATGDLPWSLPLAGADTVRVERSADLPAGSADGRSVVLVLRDPQRHPWQLELVPRADVVVDCGWPADLDGCAVPVIRTRGIAPGLMRAAARALEDAR